MALSPQNDDAFFREVNEEVRRDRLSGLWQRWGTTLLIGVGVILVALAAGLWWKSHRAAQAAHDGEQLTSALADAESGRLKPQDPRLVGLASSPRRVYRALGGFTAAGVTATTDPKAAATRFRAIADDSGQPQPLRDLALIRATTLQFDQLSPQAVVAAMKPLAQPGGPWFGSAGELVGAAYLKMKRTDLAGPVFAAIARDPATAGSLRARAATMASALGQDAGTLTPAGALKE